MIHETWGYETGSNRIAQTEFETYDMMFEKIHESKEQSLILISHQERIIQMADRIMVIEDGKIKAIGSKDEVYPSLMGSSARHSCIEM